MIKKSIAIPILAIILILTGSLLTNVSAAPPKPLIVMDGGYENIRIAAPSGISASDGTYSNQISVNWSSVGGATYYEVYRNTTTSSGTATLLHSPTSAPFYDTSPTPGVHYYYWVKACDSSECSPFSAFDNGFRALLPPTSIIATDGTFTDKVVVTWPSSLGANYYQVWRNATSSSGGAINISNPSSTTFNDTGAAPGTLYYYWVKACSTSTGCTALSSNDDGYRAITPPSSINATDGSYTGYVQLNWSSTSGATSYNLYRHTVDSSAGATLLIGSLSSTSFSDSSATHGLQYYYWVKGCSSTVCSDFSPSDSGYRAISQPTSVSATDGTYTDRVDISWSSSSGATFYEIWRNTSSSPGSASKLPGDPSSSPFSDTTGTPGTLYYYWVKACTPITCSTFSSSNSGYRALTPPSGISATDGTYTNRVEVTWSASTGAAYYYVWRNTTNSPGGASQIGSISSPPYNDTGAAPGTLYYYYVKACSTSTGCTALASNDDGYRAITPPSSINATDGTFTDRVSVSWSSTSGATSYEIWRNTSSSSGGASKLPGDPSSGPYNDTTATPGIPYYYWVKGCSTTGCSDFSPINNGYRAISPPTGVSATDGTHTDKVALTWNPSDGATYYEVWRNTSSSPGGSKLDEPSSSPYNDITATPGSQYHYFVKGCTPITCSGNSSLDAGYRALIPPNPITASNGTYTDRVLITWPSVQGATSYQVWRHTSDVPGSASLLTTVGGPSHNDTTATQGVLYYYWVKGCASIGCSDFSSSGSGFKALTPPTGVSATDGTHTDRVTVSWNPSSGAEYYEIWRSIIPDDEDADQLPDSPTSSSPYDDFTGTPGYQYYYWVKACASVTGCSDFSSEDTGFRNITPPTGVSASDGEYTTGVELSWSLSEGATYYEIWRNTSNVFGGAKLGDEPSSSPYDDTSGAPGQLYYYFVKGCNATTCSESSSSDDGYRALTPPTNVSATDGTHTDRTAISWSSSSGATYYEVWRMTSTRSGEGLETAEEKIGETASSPFNDTTGTPGTLYTYKVTACSDPGCSELSDSNSGYRAMTPPTGVSATDGTHTDRVSVSWSESDGADFYEIWRNTTDSSGSASQVTGEPYSSPFSDTTATPGVLYYYWVKACSYSTGCTGFSGSDDGFRSVNPPTGVSASDGTYLDKVEITWNPSTGATYYEVWRNTTATYVGATKLSGDPTSSPYNDTSATPGVQYHYWVKGCAPTGCSGFLTNDDGYRALPVPPSVEASDDTYTDKVVITWIAVPGATYYEVWRDETTRVPELLPGQPTGTSYDDLSATPGVIYLYYVKACTVAGCSELSIGDAGSRAIAMDQKIYLPLLLN